MAPENSRKKKEGGVTTPTGSFCWRIMLVGCLAIIILGSSPQPVTAAAEDRAGNEEEILLSWVDDTFVYQREGRPDPFAPFIPEKLVQIEVAREELTGMRRFEPGQLTLVSIVMTEKEPLAMVQDSVGKGYIIKKGSKLGRSGVVAEIISNEVIIEQQMLTATGEKRSQTVEMVLRKEGEK